MRSPSPDLTTRGRIRDAALELYTHGLHSTTDVLDAATIALTSTDTAKKRRGK